MEKGKASRLLQIFWIIPGLVVVIALLFYTLKLIEPSSLPQNVFITNITDHKITISWITDKPTRGTVYVSKDGKFPLLPFLSQNLYKDDGEKNSARAGFYTAHMVTVNNLNPVSSYQFRIYQGWKRVYQGSFATGSILKSITAPNPVYGRVLKAGNSPSVGTLVYLLAKEGKKSSSYLSTLTNQEGRWSLDPGNLRSRDLKSEFKVSTKSAEILVVETEKGSVRAETKPGFDKPWPDIILK